MATAVSALGTYIDVLGVRTFYIQRGSGPAVFLMHGASPGASSWVNWRPTIDGLAERGFTVYAFDQPGFGYSGDPPEYSIEFRVEHARAFVAACGVERCHLIGNSVGGYLVARLALADQALVERLVIVSSASLAPPGSGDSQAKFQAHFRELREYEPSLENMRKLTTGTLYHQELVTDELVAERHAMSVGAHQEAERRRAAAPPLRPVHAELPSLRMKSLLVWGANDRGGSLEKALLLFKAIPGAELHIFDHCAHWPQWDHAARFNALVSDFLKG